MYLHDLSVTCDLIFYTFYKMFEKETTITLPWRPYGIAYNSTFSTETRLAVSSFELNDNNFIRTYQLIGSAIISEKEYRITFPQTRLLFNPQGSSDNSDLLLSCGDKLRLFNTNSTDLSPMKEININSTNDPITCADWNSFQNNIVITGSTDTTASAIDINTGNVLSQLIAHDNPLHDICFCGGPSTFITAGFDGSIRFFDLRDTQSSYIYYKTALPILRALVNPYEPNKIAIFAKKSNAVTLIDTRRPCVPCGCGAKHDHNITAASWSKTVEGLLYSADDHGCVKSADFNNETYNNSKINEYFADSAIESLALSGGYAAIATKNSIQIVKGSASVKLSPTATTIDFLLQNL